MTVLLVVLSTWVLIGFLAGFYEVRRGHWTWLWLLGAMAGPMVIPLARQLQRDEVRARPIEVRHGTTRSAVGLRVLAGIDGSAASMASARRAADLLGSRLGELVLATVVDYEAVIDPAGELAPRQPWDAEARRVLDMAADELGSWLGFEPATVLLAGRPADALQSHAEDAEFDLVVVGCRGAGLSKRLIGSCAADLARGATVPVFLMPPPPEEQGRAPSTGTAVIRP